MLKAADICALQPERAARFLVAKDTSSVMTLRWKSSKLILRALHDWNPEDTLRFSRAALREIGMIKSTPQKIIEQGRMAVSERAEEGTEG